MKQYQVITDIKMTYITVVEARNQSEAKRKGQRIAMTSFENGSYDIDVESQVSEFPEKA